ncbi:MAG: hypothetical protein ACLTXT_03215 [Ruminococcus callidus]
MLPLSSLPDELLSLEEELLELLFELLLNCAVALGRITAELFCIGSGRFFFSASAVRNFFFASSAAAASAAFFFFCLSRRSDCRLDILFLASSSVVLPRVKHRRSAVLRRSICPLVSSPHKSAEVSMQFELILFCCWSDCCCSRSDFSVPIAFFVAVSSLSFRSLTVHCRGLPHGTSAHT